ncbi:MAG: TetR/AcrR family transcriptional regulator [Pseudomonadota bacterium]
MEGMTRREREKQAREEEIITAAEKIFCVKGFEEASMDEIAAESQFTKRTLYQYFTSKEELYFAVALKGMKKLGRYIYEASEKEKTGFLKIKSSAKGYYRFYRDFPETLRLMSYIGHVKKKSGGEGKWRKELMQFDDNMFLALAGVIDEGKTDGSIREDIDAKMASYSLIFMMTGFFTQLSTTGETFMKHFSLEDGDFTGFSIDLLLSSVAGGR